jgi:hypothetical protein
MVGRPARPISRRGLLTEVSAAMAEACVSRAFSYRSESKRFQISESLIQAGCWRRRPACMAKPAFARSS